MTKVTCKNRDIFAVERSSYVGLKTRVSSPQLERKRMLLAATLVCAKVWFPERPNRVQGTKGDSVCLWCGREGRDKVEKGGGD